jgi:acetolactate synthase-1/2/3 large subunit
VPPHAESLPTRDALEAIRARLTQASAPLIVAGGMFERSGGRELLLRFAEAWHIPVVLSFRRNDVFPNRHALYAGELGLVDPRRQLDAFRSSDLILALGTRFGDITSQGYGLLDLPRPRQTFVHCYPDDHIVGLHCVPDFGLVCDPLALVRALPPEQPQPARPARTQWAQALRGLHEARAAWPERNPQDGVDFTRVVRALYEQAPSDVIVCVDAGTFAAPIYRHFQFQPPQRLMAPVSGAMGYGVPAAIATQLRFPARKVICAVGDGGFMMTGNEAMAAVQRKLPVLFILSNNASYASIRIYR